MNPRRLTTVRWLLLLATLGPAMYPIKANALDDAAVPVEVRAMFSAVCLVVAVAMLARRGALVHVGVATRLPVAFCSFALASTFWSVDRWGTFTKSTLLLITFIALTLLVRTYPAPDQAVRHGAAAVYVAMLGAGIEAAAWPSRAFSVGIADTTARMSMIFPTISPNQLGHLAAVALAGVLLGVGPDWSRRFAVPLGAVFAVELYLTHTRSALLVGGVVLVIAWAQTLRRTPWAAPVSILAVAAGVGAYATVNLGSLISRGQDARLIATLSGRTDIWAAATDLWSHHKATGLGYYAAHAIALPATYRVPKQPNIDNTWIEVLLGVGLFGVIPLACFALLGTGRAILAGSLIDSPARMLTAIVCVYYLAISFVNPTLQTNSAGQLVFGFALLVSIGWRSRLEQLDLQRLDPQDIARVGGRPGRGKG